ncbi:diaminopimelate epimerase [Halocynthiibacter sp.]|uniref:diaminopimelate epimerase n=1 Tax=Halocynthiibacter sp. TaxID=1979210 RepID=UPI003C41953A
MQHKNTSELPFRKMHGLGNDFVVIDTRHAPDVMSAKTAKAIANRYFGVGFDQLVILRESTRADLDVEFWNSDGSRADACGNASRCITRLILEETGADRATFFTGHEILTGMRAGTDLFSVNMGQPQLTWDQVPLSHDVDDINALPVDGSPGACGMGNPHMVFVVDDADMVDLRSIGPDLEHHALYPERTNVEFIQVRARDDIRMRVWERGGEITLACGSGACAAAVVAHRKGLTDRKVKMQLDGGWLEIDWREDGVWMTGPAAHVFDGTLSAEFLKSVE